MPPSSGDERKVRRAHKKSRYGCKECKRRHIKCDETLPACVNCTITERLCSYVNSPTWLCPPTPPTPANGLILPGRSQSPVDGEDAGRACSPTKTLVSASPSLAAIYKEFVSRIRESECVSYPTHGQIFALEHLYLFQHLQTAMPSFFGINEQLQSMVEMSIEVALTTPYLMDAMLAHAATHLAATASETSRAEAYRRQATQLQTRGIAIFNKAEHEVSDDNCIPMFLFASTIGTQVLCETLSTNRDNFSAFLDQFTWYLTIHRGVGAVTARSWHVIQQSGAKEFLDFMPPRPHVSTPETDVLNHMLKRVDLGSHSLAACRSAVEVLQHAFSIYRSTSSKNSYQTASVMAFGAHISTGFVDILKQRRPESLVLLAYYAVLLYWCRDCWVFGDAGEFMLRSIPKQVGESWAIWLAFPCSVLEHNVAADR